MACNTSWQGNLHMTSWWGIAAQHPRCQHTRTTRQYASLIRTFVTVDGGAQEHEVRPQHGSHDGQRYGGGLVDDQQLGLRQPRVVLRLDVLHRLRAGSNSSRRVWAVPCQRQPNVYQNAAADGILLLLV